MRLYIITRLVVYAAIILLISILKPASSIAAAGQYQFTGVTCAGQPNGNYTGISYTYGTVFCLQQGVLLAKIDGRKNTWAQASPMWTDTSATTLSNFNAQSLAFNQIEARFPVYASLPINSINVGFAPFTTTSAVDNPYAINNAANIVPVLTQPMSVIGINLPVTQTLAAAMSSTISPPAQNSGSASSNAYGTNVINGVTLSQPAAGTAYPAIRVAWNTAVGAGGITSEPYCNVAGINSQANVAYTTGSSGNFASWNPVPQCRIGLMGNNEADCASVDTMIGLGCIGNSPPTVCANNGYYSAGFCEPCCDSGFKLANYFGYITGQSQAMLQILPCPAGTYSGAAGASSCTPCSAGTFMPSVGASVCFTTPAGYYSIAGQTMVLLLLLFLN